MFLGQYRPALAAADKIRAIMTEDILTMKDRPKLVTTTEAYYAMKMHVLVRFGRWHEIIEEPTPGDPRIYRISTPMHHYARGIAHATLKDPVAADRERTLFREAVVRIPEDLKFLSNLARTTLGVAEAMLDGEVEYHRGNYDEAFAHLREAVHRDDSLNYTEPWAWMHPPRHALAALLLDQGHVEEAERVYRDDLGLSGQVQRCAQHPDNVWALHGLVECLRRRGERAERPDLEDKLEAALAKADVPIASSCFCRVGTTPGMCCH
jgi:tetratricopeptide (TPR) repeat protein